MIEIKAGPELDKAVADAIGDEPALPFSIARAMAGEEGFTYNLYSTDLNAAFAAAEKVGLWAGCSHILGKGSAWRTGADGHWWIHHTRDGSAPLSFESEVSSGHSLALAICAAILALRETP
jgi:hypothetical protein